MPLGRVLLPSIDALGQHCLIVTSPHRHVDVLGSDFDVLVLAESIPGSCDQVAALNPPHHSLPMQERAVLTVECYPTPEELALSKVPLKGLLALNKQSLPLNTVKCLPPDSQELTSVQHFLKIVRLILQHTFLIDGSELPKPVPKCHPQREQSRALLKSCRKSLISLAAVCVNLEGSESANHSF